MTDQERTDFLIRHHGWFTDMVKGPGANSWEDRAAARKAFKTR